MSKGYVGLSAAALLAVGLGWGPPAASAAPVAGALAINNAATPALEQVAWGRGWGGGGWGGRGWGGGWGGRGWGWGVGAGLLGGAIIGSALAAPYYGTPYGYGYGYANPGYYAAPAYGAPGYGPPGAAPGYGPGGDAVAFCSRRYRSYDPSSGTFLGNDGVRHPCP